MNVADAARLLEVELPLSSENIRRQYRRAALKYHPDKGGSAETFLKVCTAHDVLLGEVGVTERAEQDYASLVKEMLDGLFVDSGKSTGTIPLSTPTGSAMEMGPGIIHLMTQIATGCKRAVSAFGAIRDLDGPACLRALAFLERHANLLHISADAIHDLKGSLEARVPGAPSTAYVVSAPLDQILEGRIYKLHHEGETYMVPLWHEQLSFLLPGGSELMVTCKPKLPEGVTIDEYNDLHVHVEAAASTILTEGCLRVPIGEKVVAVNGERLRIQKRQTHRMSGEGCPRLDIGDVYNDSVKGDIVVHVDLI